MRHRHPTAAFTLVELLVVIAVAGLLAAVALPTYLAFVRRTKTAEATSNLSMLFKGAVAYYSQERANAGLGSLPHSSCTVGAIALTPSEPGANPQYINFPAAAEEWGALSFSVTDPIRFAYQVDSDGAGCGNQSNDMEVYTFRAHGDLDEDGTLSTFELAVGSGPTNDLFHARGFYIQDEIE